MYISVTFDLIKGKTLFIPFKILLINFDEAISLSFILIILLNNEKNKVINDLRTT